jgi:hypothetical protein
VATGVSGESCKTSSHMVFIMLMDCLSISVEPSFERYFRKMSRWLLIRCDIVWIQPHRELRLGSVVVALLIAAPVIK